MKKISKYTVLALLTFLLFACGGINSDAKKAAKLTHKSIEQSVNMDFEKSEKNYRKAQEIIRKYDGHKKSEKFHKLYRKYRDEGKSNQHH